MHLAIMQKSWNKAQPTTSMTGPSGIEYCEWLWFGFVLLFTSENLTTDRQLSLYIACMVVCCSDSTPCSVSNPTMILSSLETEGSSLNQPCSSTFRLCSMPMPF